MPAAYSLDFRKKAVAAVKRGERKSDICRTLGLSRNTLDLWLKRKAETGSVAARTDFHRGAKPLIENLDEFRDFVEEYGHLTQKRDGEAVAESCESNLVRTSAAPNQVHSKKKSYLHQERDEELRTDFIQWLRRLSSARMVWMDQTGFDNTLDYAYGYCHKSERFMAEKLGHRTERVSLIGAWREGEFLAPMLFEGYTNSELVCGWIEEMLLPEMLPGQILILDNASFHPKKRIQELLAKAGCDVMFLPPYSSDLNKIEKYWARLKHEVSQVLEAGMSLIDTIAQVIRLMS